MTRRKRVLNYYFLNRFLHPNTPQGFRETVVALITHKSKGVSCGKHLLIEERYETWGLPKKGIEGKNMIDGITNALVEDIGNEMGLKGITVLKVKPQFIQKAYFINFAKQIYDLKRMEMERQKNRPSKGKIYHLAIIDYRGPLELPINTEDQNSQIKDYKWVSSEEGVQLISRNKYVHPKESELYSAQTYQFGLLLFKKAIYAYNSVQKIYGMGNSLKGEKDGQYSLYFNETMN